MKTVTYRCKYDGLEMLSWGAIFSPSDDLLAAPFSKDYWDLLTTLIWVAFRDQTLVEKLRSKWLRSVSEPDENGLYLKDFRREALKNLITLFISEEASLGVCCLDAEPMQTLQKALVSSKLEAFGRPSDEANLELIPAREWSVLRLHLWPNLATFFGSAGTEGPTWLGLTFDRDSVLSTFPPPRPIDDAFKPGASESGLSATIAGPKDQIAYIEIIKANWPDGQPPGTYKKVWVDQIIAKAGSAVGAKHPRTVYRALNLMNRVTK